MITVTIPKKITGGKELVIITREIYEKLLALPKKDRINYDLERGVADARAGRVIGPFSDLKKGLAALKGKNSRR